MKQTTLRTSAIALGVAAALPATGQEWNLQWGGSMQQRIAVASSEQKFTRAGGDIIASIGSNTVEIDFIGIDSVNAGASDDAIIEVAHDAETTAIAALFVPVADGGQVEITDLVVTGATTVELLTEFQKRMAAVTLAGGEDGANEGQSLDGLRIRIESGTGATGVESLVNAAIADQIGKDHPTIKLSGGGQNAASEIHFKPSVTLENGLTFGAHIELEADADDTVIDESYMTISSDTLGMFTIGGENSEGYRLMVAAPGVGLGINSGAHQNFLPGYGFNHYRQAAGSSNTEVNGNNDVMRISYRTPSLGGLTLGVSYAPNGNSSNQLKEESKGDLSDIIDVGAKFKQSLGEAGVTLSARYGTGKMHELNKKPREAAVGAQVSFGAFTLGGAYADSEAYTDTGGNDSSSGWSLGASYAMEAWTFGIETYQGEHDNGDEQSVSKIAASRTLGPGVAWDLYAITAEGENSGDKSVKVSGIDFDVDRKTSGTIFGTAIKLTF